MDDDEYIEKKWNEAASKPLCGIETLLENVTMTDKQKVKGFTGPRQAPTPHDWELLENAAKNLLEGIQKKECRALAWVIVNNEGSSGHGWSITPGASLHALNSEMHMMGQAFSEGLLEFTKEGRKETQE